MKKIYMFVMALTVLMGFSACSDELDIQKLGNLGSEDDFYKTDGDAEAAITNCYNDLTGMYDIVKGTDDLLSDDVWCGGGNRNDNAERENLGSYTFGSTNGNIQTMYESLYTLIYHANLVIEKFTGADDTPVKKRDVAEAYFFRGFAHFYLGAYFGTAPVVDAKLKPGEYAKENSTREQIYAQAASDFQQAVNSGNLSEKSTPTQHLVRITKQAAQAYLGKTLVFAGKYQEAIAPLNEVINSGKYALNTGAYENLLHEVNDYDAERLLESNIVRDLDNLYFNLYALYHGFRSDYYDWKVPAGSDQNNAGYGFYNPTKNLYDAFVTEEGANGYRLNQTIKTEKQINAEGIYIANGKVLHGHEGYWNWKQRLLQSEVFTGLAFFTSSNFVWMRYAEVLLLAAEANLQSNNTAEALKYINMVRSRAQLPALTSITMDDVKTEKRLELWGEGTRWMDLVRWGDAAQKLADKGKQMPGFKGGAAGQGQIVHEYDNVEGGFVAGKNEMLPIPDQEIKLNDNMKQNPKY